MGTRGVILVLALLVAGCAPRLVAMRAPPDPAASIVPVFGVTGRRLDTGGATFGNDRPHEVQYFRVDVSVPPVHVPGRIEWNRGEPSAATDFVVTRAGTYKDARALVSDMRRTVPRQETMLYVHGYNNTLSDSIFRVAQIITDFKVTLPGVVFAWPSAGDPRGYLYDRDSVLFARDDLERTLRDLTDRPGEKVFLLAHSMGAQLTMETLRQIALKGDHHLFDRISGVALISPDIDPDLFARQAAAIGTLPQPFVIFISRTDRALSLSGLVTGSKPRLGVIDAADEVQRPDVQVVDMTDMSDGAVFNHLVAVTSPEAIDMLTSALERSERGGRSLLQTLAAGLSGQPLAPR